MQTAKFVSCGLAVLGVLASLIVTTPQARAQFVYDRSNTPVLTFGSGTTVFDTWWDSVIGARSLRVTAANVGQQAGSALLAALDTNSPSTGFISASRISWQRQWDVDFQYRADRGSGADGLAFVIISMINGGSVFTPGGGLGYQGSHCFAIEFDTFDNGGGENGIQAMLSSPAGVVPLSANVRPSFSLRGTHRVRITCRFRIGQPPWDNRDRIISVYMDGNSTPILTHWMPSAQLHAEFTDIPTFGFTAGTGGLADEHLIFPDWRLTVY